MGREFELKYRATPEILEAIQAEFEGFAPICMETTYYDAPDGAFSQRRWTLRRRMENGVSVCTMKADLRDGSRGEWECRCEEILEALPQLIALGAPGELSTMVKNGVHPTCGARFTRLAASVAWHGSVLELALDRGALLGGGKEAPLCEVEVELKQGCDADAVQFAQALAARHALAEESRSKLRRALELAGK